MEKCLIFLSSITSQFRSFFHWIVFNLFFCCVTMKTIYSYEAAYQISKVWSKPRFMLTEYPRLCQRFLCSYTVHEFRDRYDSHSFSVVRINVNAHFPLYTARAKKANRKAHPKHGVELYIYYPLLT